MPMVSTNLLSTHTNSNDFVVLEEISKEEEEETLMEVDADEDKESDDEGEELDDDGEEYDNSEVEFSDGDEMESD